MFGYVNKRLQQATLKAGTTLGGVSVVLGGHHAQLPPVKDLPLYDRSSKLDEYQSLGASAYSRFKTVVILRRQERQKSTDEKSLRFITMLDHFENGSPSIEDWRFVKRLSEENLSRLQSDSDTWTLASRIIAKDAENASALGKYSKDNAMPVARMRAVCSGKGAERVSSSDAGNLDLDLCVCKGARVMVTSNLWLPAGLVNGAVGHVYDIIYGKGQGPPSLADAVLVQFSDTQYYGPSALPTAAGVVSFAPLRRDYLRNTGRRLKGSGGVKKWENIPCTRTQYPLTLAFTLTIHKSQGLSLKGVIVNLGPSEFASGLTYTR